MNVVYGNHLRSMIDSVANLQRRECHTGLMAYINGANTARVCTIYGLRRTGKTTLLGQAMLDLSVAEFQLAAYIKAQCNQTMRMLEADLENLYRLGYRYVFIDEVTLLEDFIDTASCLSDIYAAMGMKIILTGADSLGLWLAGREELYDRTYLIHTTWISFPEHARLIGANDIIDPEEDDDDEVSALQWVGA